MTGPRANSPKILPDDIRSGYITRYFIRHISSNDLIEIDAVQYNLFKNIPLYEIFSLKWFIIGEDAVKRNEASIKLYTDITQTIVQNTPIMLKGLRGVLRSPEQYVILKSQTT